MKMRVSVVPEPMLQFGSGIVGTEPKVCLVRGGPLSPATDGDGHVIKLGLVALPDEVEPILRWVDRMHRFLLSEETNAKRFKEFPGIPAVFRCRFEVPSHFIRRVDIQQYERLRTQLGNRPTNDSFEALLSFWRDTIRSLFGDRRPDCVLVGFPEEIATLRVANPRLTFNERRALERLQEDERADQLSLFEPSEEEKRAAADLMPQAEELLFRNFHRALKAACMAEHNAVPLQVVRRQTYVSAEAKQSDSTRAWNLSLALYYKSGNIPWRPHGLTPGVCFVGVSFHHLKRRSGSLMYASVAQAFASDIEPFALKGSIVPPEQVRDKQPYLSEEQAADLIGAVVREYNRLGGIPPTAVVVHKTSRYQPEEEAGFGGGLQGQVAGHHFVWMAPTGFRLLRSGMREPLRGTICSLGDDKNYLFTTGFVPWWQEYPGPHIPSPLQFGTARESDMEERAKEILALTKMNWNSADGIGRSPITLAFARRVGIVMTEMGEDVVPNPLYRFYM